MQRFGEQGSKLVAGIDVFGVAANGFPADQFGRLQRPLGRQGVTPQRPEMPIIGLPRQAFAGQRLGLAGASARLVGAHTDQAGANQVHGTDEVLRVPGVVQKATMAAHQRIDRGFGTRPWFYEPVDDGVRLVRTRRS